MADASGSGSSRYGVESGESLIDIAQAAYGDGALRYVVADANGVVAEPADPLPSTELGKAYELPDEVSRTHSATPCDSIGLTDNVAHDRPIAVPPPPPTLHCHIEILAQDAVSLTDNISRTCRLERKREGLGKSGT